jgi:iron complex transport system ATP-binding protein
MLLKAQGISFAYGAREVLRAVDLTLDAGELVALLGPNGSGKTTLVRVLLGLLRGDGEVLWEGKTVSKWSRRELARKVAYLPQSPTFEEGQRVADVLRLGRSPYWKVLGLESEHDVRVVNDVAEMLELSPMLDERVEELSGGQRQRVFIGRCLVQQPAAMLLDEPDTFLDLKHQAALYALLRRLAKEKNVAVLVASHDLNLAAMHADRLVLLGDGKVAAAGSANEVLRPELIEKIYGVAMERVERGRLVSVLPVAAEANAGETPAPRN